MSAQVRGGSGRFAGGLQGCDPAWSHTLRNPAHHAHLMSGTWRVLAAAGALHNAGMAARHPERPLSSAERLRRARRELAEAAGEHQRQRRARRRRRGR
jgi:hypothetical protein